MPLTDTDLKTFDDEGTLLFPGAFTPDTAPYLRHEAVAE